MQQMYEVVVTFLEPVRASVSVMAEDENEAKATALELIPDDLKDVQVLQVVNLTEFVDRNKLN